MTDEEVTARVRKLIDDCETALDDGKDERQRALDYFDGKMPDLTPPEGMSSIVSPEVRATIKKVMPSLMRSILGNDKIGEFEPVSPDQEDQAEQATDYLNHVIVPESKAADAIYDAVHDALLMKTGVLKWSAYERTRVVVSDHTGQTPDAMLGLDEIGTVENVEADANGLFSFRLRRRTTEVQIRLEAVPRGALLIHPTAVSFADSPLVGERLALTRSELVSRGYDRGTVAGLKTTDEPADADEDERDGDTDLADKERSVAKEMELVRVWDCYVQMDADNDGIAETHHVVMAEGSRGSKAAGTILKNEPAPEVPYAALVVERSAHQFEGRSLAEDAIPIQRVTSQLLRGTLDNLYWSNNPQPFVNLNAVMDAEAIYDPLPGKPVLVKDGYTADTAISWRLVPFMADKSFPMLEYFQGQLQDRTGVTDASGGLDLEALQNVSATASALAGDSAVAQTELMLRQVAPGIKLACEGLLRLIVAHADRPRTVRLRGKWVDFDPQSWDAEMAFTVNVGLGAGSRQRDMAALAGILGVQKEIIAFAGAGNPLVTVENVYNTVAKMAEASGFNSADPYFNKPTPEQVQATSQPQQGPSEAEVKAQAQTQIEAAKAQARAQVEAAQRDADLVVQQARIEAERQRAQMQIEHEAQMENARLQLEALKHRDENALEWAKLDQHQATVLPVAGAL